MSLTVVNGLPAHVLFVHFVIVLVPLSALALVVCAAWPAGARRLGLLLPILALVTLASVPVATHAGEWLEQHVGSNPLVRKHAELGDGLLPWALGLFVISAVVWWTARRSAPPRTARRGSHGRPRYWFGARSWLFLSLSRSAPWWTSTGSATREPRRPGRTTTPRRPSRTAVDMTRPSLGRAPPDRRRESLSRTSLLGPNGPRRARGQLTKFS